MQLSEIQFLAIHRHTGMLLILAAFDLCQLYGKKKLSTKPNEMAPFIVHRAKFLFKRLRMREKFLGQDISWEGFAS